MSNTAEECREIVLAAEKTGHTPAVCNVLRYTSFYMTLKNPIDRGEIGEVTTINQIENVGYWHKAHSFVRDNRRTFREISPMILQKSYHDMDIILWLKGKDCKRVIALILCGTLMWKMRRKVLHSGVSMDAPHATTCPDYAPALYLDMNCTVWSVGVITTNLSEGGRRKALEEGPYGRRVYHCDNDVVDRQVVNLEFESGAVAIFTMTGLSADFSRTHRESWL